MADAEVEAIRGRALARGATEAQPLRRESYGGLSSSFRDPEGQLWSVGGYDPRRAGAWRFPSSTWCTSITVPTGSWKKIWCQCRVKVVP